MQGPFRGVRILDCSEGTAGPLAAMLLGDLGADVIKVEPPAGDRLRGTPAFHVLNRSKRGMVADLRTEAGQARLETLLPDADVLIFSGSPSSSAERGLDAARLQRAYPRLIIVQLPMYGREGPFADLREDDDLLNALCGHVGMQPSRSGRPVYQFLKMASTGHGILTAITIGACLIKRERTGRGDRVELLGLNAGHLFYNGMVIPDVDPAVESLGNPRFAWPTYGFHQGSDGGYFFVGALGVRDWVRLAAALQLDDFLDDPAFSDGVLGVERAADSQRLLDRLIDLFSTQPRDHWVQVLVDADVAVGPMQTREEFFDEEQVQHLSLVAEVDDLELGPTRQLGLPVTATMTPGAIQSSAPRLDPNAPPPAWRETGEPRRLPTSDGKEPAPGDLPLAGFTILDVATWIAGSAAPALLADLGANVIKVEPPDGDPYRSMALGYYGSNRNKRHVALDLKDEGGRAAFDRVVAASDIVLTNIRPTVRPRLGLDYERLRQVKPDIITVAMPPNGPGGPLRDRPAYDQVFQARSGEAWQQCGGNEPAVIAPALNDNTTAPLGALACVAGLYERIRSGQGQELSTSLLQGAMTVSAGECIFYPGRPTSPLGDVDALGATALRRIYQCSDEGWILLAVEDANEWDALTRVWGEDDWRARWNAQQALAAPVLSDLADAIAGHMAQEPRDALVAKLQAAGVGCMPCLRRNELFDHPHCALNASFTPLTYPQVGGVRQFGRFARFRGEPPLPITAAGQLGENSLEVLREYGTDAQEIERLIHKRVLVSPKVSSGG